MLLVISGESARAVDVDDALSSALDQIGRARSRSALAIQAIRRVMFDLDASDDTYFVLTEALADWADSEEFHAEDNEPLLASDRRRCAAHGRSLLSEAEEAMNRRRARRS